MEIMLFDQFGNYVIQRLLQLAIDIRNRRRAGNPLWFDRLAVRIVEKESALLKYSSGKKILEMLEKEVGAFDRYVR